jgi:hypothetical protein
MGGKSSKSHKSSGSKEEKKEKKSGFQANPDMYHSLSEVQEALQKAGLESSNRIIHVEYLMLIQSFLQSILRDQIKCLV